PDVRAHNGRSDPRVSRVDNGAKCFEWHDPRWSENLDGHSGGIALEIASLHRAKNAGDVRRARMVDKQRTRRSLGEGLELGGDGKPVILGHALEERPITVQTIA